MKTLLILIWICEQFATVNSCFLLSMQHSGIQKWFEFMYIQFAGWALKYLIYKLTKP